MIKTDHQVAYQPLGMSSSPTNDDDNESDDEELATTQRQYSDCETKLPFEEISMINSNSSDNACGGNLLSFRQLRSTLYLAAAVLFLIFVARLTTTNSDSNLIKTVNENSSPSASYLKSAGALVGQPSTISTRTSNYKSSSTNVARSEDSKNTAENSDRPKYDNYLMSVLRDKDPRTFNSNQSLDDLYTSEETTSNKTIWWTTGSRGANDEYVTVTNYVRAMKSFNSNSSITLTTQATTEFMYHVLELCKRWDGPISVALYGPGTDLSIAITVIKFMRQCLPTPLGTCIRDKVSWHLAYDRLHGPPVDTLKYPKYYVDSQHYPLFANQNECPKLPGPDASDLIRQLEANVKQANGNKPRGSSNSTSYKQQFKLTYPINVLRNTARLAATTHFVMASDVELYPSVNLVPKFINLIRENFMEEKSLKKFSRDYGIAEEFNPRNKLKFVFTLPIFEVKSNISAPRTKKELVRLFKTGDAIFFHKWVCDSCQNFPNRSNWLEQDRLVDSKSIASQQAQTQSDDDQLVVFESTQRDKSLDSWEPIFIGTNEDPMYDDRLTWEGRRDKMGQMYEMCLKNYYLFVLGNAFLVHAPGIKHIDKQDVMKRVDFIRQNNIIYDETMRNLREQYANSSNIQKC